MPDEVKDDVQEGEEESQALPIPDISAGSTEAGSAQPGFDADAFEEKFFDRLDGILDDKVDRRFKSDKDRRFNTLSKAEEILAAVEVAGGDPEKIRGSLERDALLNRLDAMEEKLSSSGAGGTATIEDAQKQKLNDEIAELLTDAKAEHGVEVSNAELQELVDSKDFRSALEYRNAVSGVIIKKAKQGNIGSGASAGASGSAVTPTGDDELLEQMETLMKHPVANAAEISKLKAEAKKRGLFE